MENLAVRLGRRSASPFKTFKLHGRDSALLKSSVISWPPTINRSNHFQMGFVSARRHNVFLLSLDKMYHPKLKPAFFNLD